MTPAIDHSSSARPESDPSDRPDVALSIPCYNEEAVLANTATSLVAAFAERKLRVELVLVDNGSTDGTSRVIDELIAAGAPVIKRRIEVNQGYGNGILNGLAACRGRIVGFLHADGQCDAADVVKVCELALRSPTPVFVKVRRRFRMDGLRRKVISICYNALANVMYPGIGSLDVNGSPKVFPREYLAAMSLRSSDWFIDPEMMLRSRELELPVIEINVLAQMRPGGHSHVSLHTCREFVANLFRYRVGLWNPRPLPAAESDVTGTATPERPLHMARARSSA